MMGVITRRVDRRRFGWWSVSEDSKEVIFEAYPQSETQSPEPSRRLMSFRDGLYLLRGDLIMKKMFITIVAILPFVIGQSAIAQDADSLSRKAMDAYRQKHFVESATLFELAIAAGTKNPIDFYNAACCFALTGRKQKAWGYLEQSVSLGYHDMAYMQKDSDLVSLWSEPRWKEFIKKLGVSAGSSTNQDNLINMLNNIAAQLYQYRIRPASMAGGNGSYTGFQIPVKMSSDADGSYRVLILCPDLAEIEATSNLGKGTITCQIDTDGKFIVSSWKRTGEFK